MISTNATLSIFSALSDTGVYYCEASIGNIMAESNRINVVVFGKFETAFSQFVSTMSIWSKSNRSGL